MPALPKIISVDDHVIEPPNVFSDRLPKKYADRGPRIERKRGMPQIPTPAPLRVVEDDGGQSCRCSAATPKRQVERLLRRSASAEFRPAGPM